MRRISYWQKNPRGRTGTVRGVALQDLGFDCFAVYVSALVEPIPATHRWRVSIERHGFFEQHFEEGTRHRAMMRVEHEIAVQWGKPTPTTTEKIDNTNLRLRTNPDPVPHADTKKWKFWKAKPPVGPAQEPRYMQLLTPEVRRMAKLPAQEALHEAFGDPTKTPDGMPRSKKEQVLLKQIREAELEIERLDHGPGKTPEELAREEG